MRCLPVLCVLIALLLPATFFSQNTDDAVKEKQRKLFVVVEQALADIQNLRLPENRALFYSRIGNVQWESDKKRSLSLFQDAAAELINAQDLAETRRSSNPHNELLTGGSTRQQVLHIIASRNAELALELLAKTRPAAVQRALLAETIETRKISNYSRGNNYLAQNERQLEQNFYRMAADQSPERAVELLKESLSKALSSDTLYQLQRLAEKDQAASAEMASRVIEKLLRSDFMSEGQPLYINIQVTQAILDHARSGQNGAANKLRFDSPQVQELANKLISICLSDQRVAPYLGSSIIPIAEKFSPKSVDQVRKRVTASTGGNVSSDLDGLYQKLMAADTTAEQMLAAAHKFPFDMRRQIYQSASNKLLAHGETQAARDILADNFADETRDQVLSGFDMQTTYNLMNAGKFAEAEQVIDLLPEQQRVQAIINLANTAYSRDQAENKAYALSLLAKAAQLTSERPENSVEMTMLMQVIAGYSIIEPDEAFRLFEGLVSKINELTDAVAVINGFQSNSNVREGEFIITQGDPFNSYGANAAMIGTLGRHDFDRAMKLIDGFTRQEMRISLRLQVAANNGVIASLPLSGSRLR